MRPSPRTARAIAAYRRLHGSSGPIASTPRAWVLEQRLEWFLRRATPEELAAYYAAVRAQRAAIKEE